MAQIWKTRPTPEQMNQFNKNGMDGHIGIEFTEVGDDYLIAKMPVDHRTKQPMGKLHGGANVVLAETLGSVASVLCLEDMSKQTVVGVEVNANHLRSASSGYVHGKVTPIKLGRRFQIWEINIHDDEGRHTCVSRITIAVIDKD